MNPACTYLGFQDKDPLIIRILSSVLVACIALSMFIDHLTSFCLDCNTKPMGLQDPCLPLINTEYQIAAAQGGFCVWLLHGHKHIPAQCGQCSGAFLRRNAGPRVANECWSPCRLHAVSAVPGLSFPGKSPPLIMHANHPCGQLLRP